MRIGMRDCAQCASEYRHQRWLTHSLKTILVPDDEDGDNRQLLRSFSCRQFYVAAIYCARDFISTLHSERARYKLSCDLILQFHW